MLTSGSDLRDDVREAIERAWPDGVVEMAIDSEESWFTVVYPDGGGASSHQERAIPPERLGAFAVLPSLFCLPGRRSL